MASPSFLINGVPCTIYIDGLGERAIVERVVPGVGPEADVVFKCPYNQRYTVLAGLVGGQVGTGRTVRYLSPMAYPNSPNLRCVGTGDIYGIKPRTDQTTGWVYYEEAIIPAHFALPTWDATIGLPGSDPSGQQFTTTRFRVSAEVFKPPDGAYFWASGFFNGEPVPDADAGLIRPRVEISMTRHLMPFVPLEFTTEYVQTVNQAPVTVGDHTFPRGCLMFAGMDSDPQGDPSSGQRVWDVTFSFLGNHSVEWNELMNAKGEWALINTDPSGMGDFPYDYLEFNLFFGLSF